MALFQIICVSLFSSAGHQISQKMQIKEYKNIFAIFGIRFG